MLVDAEGDVVAGLGADERGIAKGGVAGADLVVLEGSVAESSIGVAGDVLGKRVGAVGSVGAAGVIVERLVAKGDVAKALCAARERAVP